MPKRIAKKHKFKVVHVSPADVDMTGAEALALELEGVIIDASAGRFDEVCMNTLKRIHKTLLESANKKSSS